MAGAPTGTRDFSPASPRSAASTSSASAKAVWTALGNGDGTFQAPRVVLPDLGYNAGGWRVDRHPRFLADINNDGLADIVAFGDDGVYTCIGNGDGTFQAAQFVLGNYGYSQHWRVDRHPRFVLDINGDGIADIVGFGEDGVWVALGVGDGSFVEPLPNPVLHQFGHHQGWQVDRHPRFVVQRPDDKHAEIVGFGDEGVWTAIGDGQGGFHQPHPNPVLHQFGSNHGWRVDRHPRLLADLNGGSFADIVAFGDNGVWTAMNTGSGTFQLLQQEPVLPVFGYNQGWRVDRHPRFLADLDGNGFAYIVGFGDDGVHTALGIGNGSFQPAQFVLPDFAYSEGWRVDRHPRFVASLALNGFADIASCGDEGVWTALGDRHGGFAPAKLVLHHFGSQPTVLAIVSFELTYGSNGIWRSSDGGSSWIKVQAFPQGEFRGQFEWVLGSDHLVYAALGTAVGISRDAGATWDIVAPYDTGPPKRVNHIAISFDDPAAVDAAVIYALGESMFVSFNGGAHWIEDQGALPPNIGGRIGSFGNGNCPRVMVVSPRSPSEVYVASNADTPATLWHGDYSQFPSGTRQSAWNSLPLPDYFATGQDSGRVCLAVTRPERGNLLFYCAQRSIAYAGPLDAAAGTDWKPLSNQVHVDLHGILLSPDFAASIQNGQYTRKAGTVWLLSDGGIDYSTDGGKTFHPGRNVNTLAVVSIAGVANQGQGPVLSVTTGDNDGFYYSGKGSKPWTALDYNGGDLDCLFADPLRPHAVLIFTPRWKLDGQQALPVRDGQTVAVYETSPGLLPNVARGTPDRRTIIGPPTAPVTDPPDTPAWNANSTWVGRGFRPIVHSLACEEAPPQGDYIFILLLDSGYRLVRTLNILDITDRNEWITTATGPNQGANVFLQGPRCHMACYRPSRLRVDMRRLCIT